MNFLKSKPTLKEQMKTNEKDIRKAGRDVDRDRRELEREEKKLEMELKKLSKSSANQSNMKVLAKQLIRIRQQKARTYTANSRIASVGAQQKSMHANMKLSDALGSTTKTMANMNKLVSPEQIANTMRNFEEASDRLDMREEIINDTLDDIMNESGDEEESDAIVQQILDEIGISVGEKIATAPSASSNTIGGKTRVPVTDLDLEDSLARLKST